MLIVPLQPLPNQTLQVQLNSQPCTLEIFQYAYGLFMSVHVNNQLIIASVICQNLRRIVRSTYLGFVGDFCFLDVQGTQDPAYTGLGSRFQLLYLDPSEL